MPKLNQRGPACRQAGFIAQLLLLLLLGVGLVVGAYLVQNRTSLFSKAAPVLPAVPETSFELELEVNPNSPFPDDPTPENIYNGGKFRVDIYARSDIEEANLFAAKLKYNSDVADFVEIQKREGQTFITNWLSDSVNNLSPGVGMINLVGGVTNPGIKTDAKSGALLMASIIFQAKKEGSFKMELADGSEIYSNINNINILTTKKGAIEVPIKDLKPSPTPPPDFSCAVSVDGGVQTKAANGQPAYHIESRSKAKLTADYKPADAEIKWQIASFSKNLSDGGNIDRWGSPIAQYTAPQNNTESSESVTIRAELSYKGKTFSCEEITLAVAPLPGPKIASIEPMKVNPGDTVTIKGTNFLPYNADVSSLQVWLAQNNGSVTILAAVSGFEKDWPKVAKPSWQDDAIVFRVGQIESQVGKIKVLVNKKGTGWPEEFVIGSPWPKAFDLAKQDLAKKLGVDSSQIQTTSKQEITWGDGSLGCPKPGEVYTQTTVAGYAVVFSYNQKSYEYHTNKDELFVECYTLSTPTPVLIPTDGDVNSDGKTNLVDMSKLLSLFGKPKPVVDMNGDGVINTIDVLLLRNILVKNGILGKK